MPGSPFPKTSPVVRKNELTLDLDWLNWISSLTNYIARLLNRYNPDKSGLVTLVTGFKVVANKYITANSMIRLTCQTSSGTQGSLSVSLNPGVGFTITSTSGTDVSTVFYEIVEAF